MLGSWSREKGMVKETGVKRAGTGEELAGRVVSSLTSRVSGFCSRWAWGVC